MPENAYGLIEMAIVFGVVVLFGAWELRSIAQTRKRLREEEAQNKDKN